MSDATTETWLPIKGYENAYDISDQGRVRSRERVVNSGQGARRLVKETVRSSVIGNNGYLQVTLRQKTYMIHTLVAAAFLGPRPVGLEICHNDGASSNNSATNLRYDTVSANRRDTVAHGRNHAALRTACPKGHPYDDANTDRSNGHRRCRTCQRAWAKAYKLSRKAAPWPGSTSARTRPADL